MAFVEVKGPRFQAVEGKSVLTRRNFIFSRRSDKEETEIHQVANSELKKAKTVANFALKTEDDVLTNIFDWPIGQTKVLNTKTNFSVTFDFKPFSSDEITATVKGTKLVLQCKGEDELRNGVREIARNYQLPFNVDIKSIRFFVAKEAGRLLITANKLPPHALAIATFAPIKA